MQWGQIKTLFIFSFLVLDLFLLQQFLDKQGQTSIQTVGESQYETSLSNADITISNNVPEEAPAVRLITASAGDFTEEQLEAIRQLEGQTAKVYNKNLLTATLDKPVAVSEETIAGAVSKYVPFSSQYSFWNLNEELGRAIFFQKANSRTVYYNSGGVLIVNIENGKMTGYQLAHLKVPNQSGEDKQELINPLEVVERLYTDGVINGGDKVTDMSIGYYSAYSLDPGGGASEQLFAPVWKVTINGNEDAFYSALAAKPIYLQLDENEFIQKTINGFEEIKSGSNQNVMTNKGENTEE
ncbi:two-component system regulatory protein YycI [Halobacillus naozhouensis]|uniref:Two-component system regulatory protein YycI n=1 Tax=Halobacillus naozhouensis TaxID=554880 RepID=A0ABY8IX58_9BACI|nr:two-component system regulatory protein YycI [Halobacillus naozhouensis]WFT74818.1 two-component system regulatory protein YycI [Halobacillus naozhouensis]